ncbi:MAG: hypothetical protein ACREQ7_25175 [Candidatus Binatia bacterium]
MKTKKQGKTAARQTSRSFSTVVGTDTYEAWVRMLRKLVPDGRTHRLAVMVAGMLQYAVAIAAAKSAKERDEGSLAFSLLEASDATDPSEVDDLIHDAVVQLFKDAKVRFERTNSRGDKYSPAEDSYEEFLHWFDMPWE